MLKLSISAWFPHELRLARLLHVAPVEASSTRYHGVRYGLREDGDTLEWARIPRRWLWRRFSAAMNHNVFAGYYDAYYLKAQKVRTRIAEDFRNAWEKA